MKIQSVIQWVIRPLIAIVFILFLSFGQAINALELTPEQYPFPTKDPYLASLLSTFSPTKVEYSDWTMAYRPERLKMNFPLQKPMVDLRAYKQAKPAPLALIISGLGGHAAATNSKALGDIYIKAGYNVITLPNNFSWCYAQAVSETGLPGYMPRDSVEFYKFIQWVLDYAKNKKGMRYTSITLIGYSNGAIMAGFLAPLDQKQTQPLFKKILMINPGIDVMYGVDQLDYLNDTIGGKISQQWKDYVMGALITNVGEVSAAKDPIKALFALLEKLKIKSHHIQWVIGNNYRQSLRDVIVASHFVEKRVLKTPFSKYKLNALEEEAWSYNFLAYMNTFVIPSLSPEEKSGNITYNTSLYSQMADLRNDPRVFLFTNADDFLLKPEDIPLLRETFGQRLFLFPYGGHMGNIMVPFNIELYLKVSQ